MPERPEISIYDMISGPYKECPNRKCRLSIPSFGNYIHISGHTSYARKCYVCGHEESYPLPAITKKIVYLDQFVLSNLLILLDEQHPRHEKAMSDSAWVDRWTRIFIALEKASRCQVIVCPDSFTHRNESLLDQTSFKLNERLYEHFSGGKTLYGDEEIERFQLQRHLEAWVTGAEYSESFEPGSVCQQDLHDWSVGIRVSVHMRPYVGEVDSLRSSTTRSRESIASLWETWKGEEFVTAKQFEQKVHQEVAALGTASLKAARQFEQRRMETMQRAARGEDYDINDILPPHSYNLLQHLIRIARTKGVSEEDLPQVLTEYFRDTRGLLNVPKIKISSVMYAGLARLAFLGKKEAPKSMTDAQFISSYMPYCDAMFVDKESKRVLTQLPKDTPYYLRLDEYNTRIFSVDDVDVFIDYLERLVAEIPKSQIDILRDMHGEDYAGPYWDLIKHERAGLVEESVETENQDDTASNR